MNNDKPTRLIQITDPHLHASTDGTLLGLKTQFSLDLIIDQVRLESPKPDAIIATGDISQDYSSIAYQRFSDLVHTFNCPVRWCPGNHDKKGLMQKIGHSKNMNDHILELGDWAVLLLDSAVPGKVPGHFAESQLLLADQLLSEYKDRHVLVAFHHQPLPMGSRWIDEQMIDNGHKLIEIVKRHSQAKALIWGHVHQERDEVIDGLRYISSPSTCVQFTPKSAEFDIDSLAPGFRWFDLYPDGTIETGVSRVTAVDFEIDYNMPGY